jgi:hypothetical protein
MSDDLVKRLRCYANLDDGVFYPWVYGEAADRIKKLENENQDMSIHLEAMVAEVERLRKSLTTRFARSSPVEEKLMAAGIGKREMPTKEECLEWAAKLGVPDEYRGGVK